MHIPWIHGQTVRISKTVLTALAVVAVLAAASFIGLRSRSLPLSMLLGAMLALVFALFALRSMVAALTLVILLSPFVNMTIGTGTQSPINITIVLVAGLTGLWVVRMLTYERRLALVYAEPNLPLFIFLAAAAVSWIAGYVFWDFRLSLPDNAFSVQAGQYAMFALSTAAFLLTANHRLTDRVLQAWTMLIAAIGVWGIAATWIAYTRPAAFSGSLMMWPFVLILGQLLYNPNLKLWQRIAGWAMMVAWPLWAVTRIGLGFKGGWVPALLALALLALLHSRRTVLIFLLLIVLATGLLIGWYGLDGFLERLLYSETLTGSGLRAAIWMDVIRLGARSAVLGLGPGNYMYYWSDPSFVPESRALWGKWDTAYIYSPPSHNMFVDIFAQTGVVGLFLFVWAIVAALRLGWRLRNRFAAGFRRGHVHSVLCGFASMAVSSFLFADWLIPFVYNISIRGFRHSVYSWLLLGTLASLDYFTRDPAIEHPS